MNGEGLTHLKSRDTLFQYGKQQKALHMEEVQVESMNGIGLRHDRGDKRIPSYGTIRQGWIKNNPSIKKCHKLLDSE